MKIIYKDTKRGSIFDYAIVDGERLTQEGLAKLAGCSRRTLKRRMVNKSVEEAVYGVKPANPIHNPIVVPKHTPGPKNRGQDTTWLSGHAKAKNIKHTEESIKRGRDRRKVDLLRDLRELGEAIGEAWDE